jgi:hypothetical protein
VEVPNEECSYRTYVLENEHLGTASFGNVMLLEEIKLKYEQ